MNLLTNLLNNGFGSQEDYNCAEKIVYGANKAYKLNLSTKALKLSAGFGRGMGIESTCGALTGAIMILSHLFVNKVAHEDMLIKEKTSLFLDNFSKEMGSLNCSKLMDLYKTENEGCQSIILQSAKILDKIYNERNLPNAKK